MDRVLFVAERGEVRFEIVDDGGAGVIVYRYVAGRTTHDDEVRPDAESAIRWAEAEWGLAASAWRPGGPGERPLWQRDPKTRI